MTQRNLFTNAVNLASISQARNAFATGNFTPDVMLYMQKFGANTVVAELPEIVDTITLTPVILALPPAKLCSIFAALPDHVTTVIFNFPSLERSQLDVAANLMTHVHFAKHVKSFSLIGPRDESLTDYLAKEYQHFMHPESQLTIESQDSQGYVNKRRL